MDNGHRAVGDGINRRFDQTSGSLAQQPVDVGDAEGEDETVDRTEYDERDRRRAHGEEGSASSRARGPCSDGNGLGIGAAARSVG